MSKKLKPYFVSPGGWCLLSFHYTSRQAKVQGYRGSPIGRDVDYIHYRAWRASNDYMAFAEKNEPHVVAWPDVHFGDEDLDWKEALLIKMGASEKEILRPSPRRRGADPDLSKTAGELEDFSPQARSVIRRLESLTR